jgi:hypothetical protein
LVSGCLLAATIAAPPANATTPTFQLSGSSITPQVLTVGGAQAMSSDMSTEHIHAATCGWISGFTTSTDYLQWTLNSD